MFELDPRNVIIGAPAAARAQALAAPKRTGLLSPAALNVAAQPTLAAYSPIVLAGTVRLIELAIVALVGLAVYAAYVVPRDGFEWYYLAWIAGMSVLATAAFQAADIYQVQAFRGYEKQYFRLATAWSVVFLLVISVTFFAKVGDAAGPTRSPRGHCWC
jgi:hypothetical protein